MIITFLDILKVHQRWHHKGSWRIFGAAGAQARFRLPLKRWSETSSEWQGGSGNLFTAQLWTAWPHPLLKLFWQLPRGKELRSLVHYLTPSSVGHHLKLKYPLKSLFAFNFQLSSAFEVGESWNRYRRYTSDNCAAMVAREWMTHSLVPLSASRK